MRFEGYRRLDRDLLFRPFFEPQWIDGGVYPGSPNALWENSQRGDARGFQVFLQRRSANSFTGGVAYAYGRATLRDGIAGSGMFSADFDQQHTAQFFASYRLRPTVNVSGRWVYGSGMPVRGYFELRGGDTYLSARRNLLRMPSYQRTDLRLNKVWVRDRWTFTLFGEVINLFNRDNARFDELGGFDVATGRARLRFDRTFPILPSAGVVLEF